MRCHGTKLLLNLNPLVSFALKYSTFSLSEKMQCKTTFNPQQVIKNTHIRSRRPGILVQPLFGDQVDDIIKG